MLNFHSEQVVIDGDLFPDDTKGYMREAVSGEGRKKAKERMKWQWHTVYFV